MNNENYMYLQEYAPFKGYIQYIRNEKAGKANHWPKFVYAWEMTDLVTNAKVSGTGFVYTATRDNFLALLSIWNQGNNACVPKRYEYKAI